jgi:hypothetical protein
MSSFQRPQAVAHHLDIMLRCVSLDGTVQVFRRRHCETIHALGWPASEKRQGTKSRWVGHWRCRGLLYVADCLANKHILLSSEENGEPVWALGA